MLTPQERMAAMQKLIDRSWAVLRANPAALAHFRARNHRKRAIAVGESAHGT
jgi:erythromycin esterase-like protein